MPSIYSDGITFYYETKGSLIRYIYDVINLVRDGKMTLDPNWSLAKTLRVLGKLLREAKNL